MDTIQKEGRLKKNLQSLSAIFMKPPITYQTIQDLFSSQYGVQPPEFYLYRASKLVWFVHITGIIWEDQPNSNLSLNMGGYAGSTTGFLQFEQRFALYIYPGFHRRNQQYEAFVPSSASLTSWHCAPYEAGESVSDSLCPYYYFYDGEQLHLEDNDGEENQSMVKERDEVLLDFSMACVWDIARYLEGYRDDALPSWDMRGRYTT